MNINVSAFIEPESNTIGLSAPIEITDEFTFAVNYAKKALGIRGNTIRVIAGVREIKELKLDPINLMKRTDNDARVSLSYLLLVLGYSLEEIFEKVLELDYPFRHKPQHKQWNKYLSVDKQRVKRLWYASETLRLTKQEGRPYTLEDAAAEYLSKHPEPKYTPQGIAKSVRSYYLIDERKLNLRRTFGSWRPIVKTFKHSGGGNVVRCRCMKCGHTRLQKAAGLLEGKWVRCMKCKRALKKRTIQRQKSVRPRQFVVDVLTGMRMKTTAEVYRKYNLEGQIVFHTFRERLHIDQAIKVGDHCFMLMTKDRFGHRTYKRFLSAVGLPEDYQIPSPPDWVERIVATRKETLAKRATDYYRRRLEIKKQRLIKTASLETQLAGYWNQNNIQEYRKLREEKHQEVLERVMAEDEFYFPHMKQEATTINK